MKVTKRNGRVVDFNLAKLNKRFKDMGGDLKIDPDIITTSVASQIVDGISTRDIDQLLVSCAVNVGARKHYDYLLCAGRIYATLIQKEISPFAENTNKLHSLKLISDEYMEIVGPHLEELEALIDYSRDLTFDFFGIDTILSKFSISLHVGQKRTPHERPQDVFMRVACYLYQDELKKGNLAPVKDLYDRLSLKKQIFGSPTLSSAGTLLPQLSSCFLYTFENDSIKGIYKGKAELADISQSGGGIGLSASMLRSRGAIIKSSQGEATGLHPVLKGIGMDLEYVNQRGKRPGAGGIYIEPWHPDTPELLRSMLNTAPEGTRLLNKIFLAMWMPDLFMKRVEKNEDWTFFCPGDCPDLIDLTGEAFEKRYAEYEAMGLGKGTVNAKEFMSEIIETSIRSGSPYILFKDNANRMSNQSHLGTIRSSNLCAEIIQYSSKDEVATCNLGSIALPSFVDPKTLEFNYQELGEITERVIRDLNQVIDITLYPCDKARKSNLKHRPVGLGVQGLADVFMMKGLEYGAPESFDINKKIFETIYYHSLKASLELAKEHGPYKSFKGSPLSKGKLQFDLHGVTPSEDYDWDTLRQEIMVHGVRNSLLVALMPTATTSQALGNTESFEPATYPIYTRKANGKEYFVISKHLIKALDDEGILSDALIDKILKNNASVQNIEEIPEHIRRVYKNVYEIKQSVCLQMSADRAPYICQSQSLNLWLKEPDARVMYSFIMNAWRKGLKTGSYYTRVEKKDNAVNFALNSQSNEKKTYTEEEKMVCSLENPGECEACGS